MYNFKHDGSKFKLQIKNEQYYINEAQKTVTIVAKVYVDVPEWVTNVIRPNQLPNGFCDNGCFWSASTATITMKHTARCSENDQWDVEKGKKIAMAALEAKAYRSMAKRIFKWNLKFNAYISHLNDTLNEFSKKCELAANHDEEYIDSVA